MALSNLQTETMHNSMSELGLILRQLKQKRNSLVIELRQLNQAIRALNKVGAAVSRQTGERGRHGDRKMSAAGRKRIADAQKARWAKFRATGGKSRIA